jgi:hypothetical protein
LEAKSRRLKMSERKCVIALGIATIVLLIGLIVAVMGYNNANAKYTDYVSGHSHTDSEYQNEVTTYNNYVSNHTYTNDQYNSAIASYENNHHYTDVQYNTMQTNYQNAQSQVDNLTSIANLNKQNTWENNLAVNEGADTYWQKAYVNFVNYAGYLVVSVDSSTASNTYVEVIYTYNLMTFDRTVDFSPLGTGLAEFPVLPATEIDVRVGNSNLLMGASQTISIWYHY